MRAKLEARLDREFESMNVKVYIYHIRDVKMFGGITIATETRQDVAALSRMVESLCIKCIGLTTRRQVDAPASWMLAELEKQGFHGVAICDRRDQFSRKRGRTIAKGRLLKHIRAEQSA